MRYSLVRREHRIANGGPASIAGAQNSVQGHDRRLVVLILFDERPVDRNGVIHPSEVPNVDLGKLRTPEFELRLARLAISIAGRWGRGPSLALLLLLRTSASAIDGRLESPQSRLEHFRKASQRPASPAATSSAAKALAFPGRVRTPAAPIRTPRRDLEVSFREPRLVFREHSVSRRRHSRAQAIFVERR